MSRPAKEVALLVREARDAGWRVERTRRGHLMWYPPDRALAPVTTGADMGDPRAIHNVIAELRRRGLGAAQPNHERRAP